MGWWSECVMGGDPPYDWRFTFADVLGIINNEGATIEETYPFTRASLEEGISKLGDALNAEKDSQRRNVGWQVLAVYMLKTGADLTDFIKFRMKLAAYNDESDEWTNPGLRRAYMHDLIARIDAHQPGVCVEVPEEGLFAKIDELFSKERDKRDIVDRLVGLAAFHGWCLDGDRLGNILTLPEPEKH